MDDVIQILIASGIVISFGLGAITAGVSLMYIVYFFGAYTFGFALFYAVGSFKSFSDRLM
ncbi:tail virion protein G7P-2 [Escherichia coli]|uniref:tail virion protein G7P-2 n=1 Tax=Escherichia coli TaxID=562 RepID=UPI001F06E05E|nr:tail virion protein G7P-2 [Escherichia coli]